MSTTKSVLTLACALTFAACGPTKRDGNNGDDGSGSADGGGSGSDPNCTPTASSEGAGTCNDGIDNDCDGNVDCSDIDCSGVDGCPICGQVDVPQATPIALPDGFSSGTSCSTDSDCAGTTDDEGRPTPNCIIFKDDTGTTGKECHASYTSTLNFIGFPSGATLDDPTKLDKVCVKVEHSYLHDLNFELLSPADTSGARHKLTMQAFVGRVGPEIFIGQPIEEACDGDPACTPQPGTGFDYCWVQSPAPATTMYNANMNSVSCEDGTCDQVPAGDYQSMSPWTTMQGAPLNGDWTLRITDMFAVDNGFLFSWSITFDPSLVADCSGPIIM